MPDMDGYECVRCGTRHEGPALSYRTASPPGWTDDLADDPDSVLSDDICIVRAEHFYVQGNIHIWVAELSENFTWGVWVSLSAANFSRTLDLWEAEGREAEPPYFGWLCTELPVYQPSTMLLKTHVITRAVGTRPCVQLQPTDHPLAVEQRDGITLARVREIADLIRHG
jgi:hypothetical protein